MINFVNKVALIIGVGGACRIQKLTNMLLKNVKDQGQCFHFLILNTKTKISREFFITSGGIDGVNMLQLIQKCAALCPNIASSRRFFKIQKPEVYKVTYCYLLQQDLRDIVIDAHLLRCLLIRELIF